MLSLILATALIGTFVAILVSGQLVSGSTTAPTIDAGPVAVGLKLFESYVFPFEITSILLLVAMIGAVVLRTRRQRSNA